MSCFHYLPQLTQGFSCNFSYKSLLLSLGTAHGLSPRLAILDEVGQVRGFHDD